MRELFIKKQYNNSDFCSSFAIKYCNPNFPIIFGHYPSIFPTRFLKKKSHKLHHIQYHKQYVDWSVGTSNFRKAIGKDEKEERKREWVREKVCNQMPCICLIFREKVLSNNVSRLDLLDRGVFVSDGLVGECRRRHGGHTAGSDGPDISRSWH